MNANASNERIVLRKPYLGGYGDHQRELSRIEELKARIAEVA